jgi:hypothetical protein
MEQIPKHLNPNSSQYKMLMRRLENENENHYKTVSTPVNSPVLGMTLTGEKEAPMGKSISGMTSQPQSSQISGSGLKTINLDFRYRPKKKSTNGGRIKIIV